MDVFEAITTRASATALTELGTPPVRAQRPGSGLGRGSRAPAQHQGDPERVDVVVRAEEFHGLAHGATPCVAAC